MEKKVFSRDEILNICKPLETQDVAVSGWNGFVKMKNVDFQKLVQLRVDCPDQEAYQAALVAAVCDDLSISDAYALQKGNGFRFAGLFAAVNSYLGADVGDEEIKK